MSRFHNNFKPFRRPEARADAREAMDFLQSAEKLGALLPAASRLAQLQQACARLQPQVFTACHVVNLDNGQLQIAHPLSQLQHPGLGFPPSNLSPLLLTYKPPSAGTLFSEVM